MRRIMGHPLDLCLSLVSGLLLSAQGRPELRPPQGLEWVPDPLGRASHMADVDRVERLVESRTEEVSGARPRPEALSVHVGRKDAQGRTAMMICGRDPQVEDRVLVDKNCSRIAGLLLAAGESPGEADNHGWTALAHAAVNGFEETVRVLVAAGAYIDAPDLELRRTPLMKAAANGHCQTVEALLELGAHLDVTDKVGWSAVFFAVRNAHHGQGAWQKVLAALLEAGADPNAAVSKTGMTPVMYAAQLASVSAVRLLLAAGGSLSMVDTNGMAAVSYARTHAMRALLEAEVVGAIKREHGAWLQDSAQDWRREVPPAPGGRQQAGRGRVGMAGGRRGRAGQRA